LGASAEAPTGSASVAAGVREMGSISRFPANTTQGGGVHAPRRRAQCLAARGSSARAPGTRFAWMDDKHRRKSRERERERERDLGSQVRALRPFKLQNRGGN